jgi:hypothetical protein
MRTKMTEYWISFCLNFLLWLVIRLGNGKPVGYNNVKSEGIRMLKRKVLGLISPGFVLLFEELEVQYAS